MTTLFQQLSAKLDHSDTSYTIESAGRPRAATVSMCRYTVPDSPMTRPSIAPPTSPPSLILPPSGPNSITIPRVLSRMSSIDERLASSAPSTTSVLISESNPQSQPEFARSVSLLHRNSRPEFDLVEEEYDSEEDDSAAYHNGSLLNKTCAGGSMRAMNYASIDPALIEFGASPVLTSCLRDIARMPKGV